MRTLAHPILLPLFLSTMTALVACSSSTNDAGQTTGGAAANIGGNPNVGGTQATGGSKATGGATSSTSAVATGGKATGGTASTGGNATVGGSTNAGGTTTTGGATGAGGSTGASDVAKMCADVCKLLEERSTPYTCMPSDCIGTCTSTYAALKVANADCANAYVALYECGLTQPASDWECYDIMTISIPIPPSKLSTQPCHTQEQALLNVIMSNLTCVAAF